jgi:hypothetical protein
MSEQFTKMTLEKLLEIHRTKPIPAWLLVYLYFDIKIPPGKVFKKTHKSVYTALGMSERTYYQALHEVRKLNLIFHSNDGLNKFAKEESLLFKDVEPCTDESITANFNRVLQTSTGDCNIQQGTLQTPTGGDCKLQQGTLQTPTGETPLKGLQGNGCGSSTDFLQISFNKSINQIENPKTDEDDDGLILKKEENADDGLMMDFDLWMKKVKIPGLIADGVKKPSAYLKSLDKTTGIPLIEKYRAEWETLKSASVKANEFTNIKPKYPIGTMVYHWNSGYSGQVLSYPHKKRALIDVGDDNLLFPVDELYDAPDTRSTPTYSSLREALESQFPDLASKS